MFWNLLFQISFSLSMYIGLPALLATSVIFHVKNKLAPANVLPQNSQSTKQKPFQVNQNIAKRYNLNPQPSPHKHENPPHPVRKALEATSKNTKKNQKVNLTKPIEVTPPLPYDELQEVKTTLERLGAQGTLKIKILEKGYGPNRNQDAKIEESTFEIPINVPMESNGRKKGTHPKIDLPKELRLLKHGDK